MPLLPQVTRQDIKDIKTLIEYCSDQAELKDFARVVQENGSPVLSDEEWEEVEEDNEELLEKVANHKAETHVWACAHRLRKLVGQ